MKLGTENRSRRPLPFYKRIYSASQPLIRETGLGILQLRSKDGLDLHRKNESQLLNLSINGVDHYFLDANVGLHKLIDSGKTKK
jgi:hypothetical protein